MIENLLDPKTIAVLITVIGGFVKQHIAKIQTEKKESKKQKEKDKLQDEKDKLHEKSLSELSEKITGMHGRFEVFENQMNDIKTDVSEFKHYTKYLKFSFQLENLMRKRFNNLTENSNKEIKQSLSAAFYHAINLIKDILQADFEGIDKNYIYDNLKNAAKSVKSDINLENLRIKDFEDFATELKINIKPILNNFSIIVMEIVETKTNGERGEPFKDACLSFVTDIVNCTNKIHQKHK